MRRILISVLLLLAVTSAAFAPSLRNGFVNWDDPEYVTNNPLTRELSRENVKTTFSGFCCGHYHPATLLSLAIEYRFFGANPRIYHATNLALHLFNCILVFWLIFLLSGRVFPSFLTAVFFGVHPLNVESVAWISERKNVLCAFFFLGAIISHIYYLKNKNSRYYLFSLCLFLLSLLSKAFALTLPAVLILIELFLDRAGKSQHFTKAEHFPPEADLLQRRISLWLKPLADIVPRRRGKRSLIEKIPFFALSAIFGIIALTGQSRTGTIVAGPVVPLLAFYLAKIAAPFKLSCLYPYSEIIETFKTRFWPALAGLTILTSAVLVTLKYTKKAAFGTAFFLITISPVLAVLPIGPAIAADRYVYIPSIGLFYIAGEAFRWLYERLKGSAVPRNLLILLMLAIIASLAAVTRKRCMIWQDSVILWQDVLKNYPDSQLAHNNIGEAFMEKENYGKAIYHYRRLLTLDPGNRDAYYNLGTVYARRGSMQEAIGTLKKALEIKPDSADALTNLGNIHAALGRKDKALSLFNKALAADPNYVPAYNNLGDLYMEKGDYKKALDFIGKALEINPYSEQARKRLDIIRRKRKTRSSRVFASPVTAEKVPRRKP